MKYTKDGILTLYFVGSGRPEAMPVEQALVKPWPSCDEAGILTAKVAQPSLPCVSDRKIGMEKRAKVIGTELKAQIEKVFAMETINSC